MTNESNTLAPAAPLIAADELAIQHMPAAGPDVVTPDDRADAVANLRPALDIALARVMT